VEQHDVWVAERDGVVLGWVEVDCDYVAALYVRPDFARRGVGSMLLLHAEGEIRSAGHGAVTLEASSNAEAFYIRHGYEPRSHLSTEAGGRPMRKWLRGSEA
jgi:GNAT superfamily N-acetyltransferase